MNYKKELNKMLIGYKIKHPNEDIEQVFIYLKKVFFFFKIFIYIIPQYYI